uniref:Uncharacterized protein n=1 Tax=Panagrolaimus davidi TaxID=227884 RepID=A0A914QSM2_9BILA
MRSFTVLLLLFVIVAVFIGQSQIEACVGHDGACTGDNGSQGNCCGGMLCQKNDPSWREGRCYYRPG